MTRRAIALVVIILFIVAAFPMLDGGSSDSRASGVIAGRVHEAFQPNDGKIYILVLGSDARHGNPQRARSDAIHIVGINAKTMRGGILNFPRDSWVDIPGYGSAKINEAMERGGPQLLARTLENLTGIRLDYWVLTGFEGFQGLIRRIGNVSITLKRDIYDPGGSGARLEAGRRRLPSSSILRVMLSSHRLWPRSRSCWVLFMPIPGDTTIGTSPAASTARSPLVLDRASPRRHSRCAPRRPGPRCRARTRSPARHCRAPSQVPGRSPATRLPRCRRA